MKPSNRFTDDMLDLHSPDAKGDIVCAAGRPTSATASGGQVILDVPFIQRIPAPPADAAPPPRTHKVVIRAYGKAIVRVTLALGGDLPAGSTGLAAGDDSVMLEWDHKLKAVPLDVRRTDSGYDIVDTAGRLRMRIDLADPPVRRWSEMFTEAPRHFAAAVLPDGEVEVPFMAYDVFGSKHVESLPLAYVQRGDAVRGVLFSLHAAPGEHFAGTGERFARMDLAGQTLVLENTDALGVNSRRAYKNVPFFLSSRPYGLMALTSSHVRLSLADISTRAAQGLIEDDCLDLFFIGGGRLEAILRNYRRLTGFPRDVPLWSYGIWMSRMTYFSAKETLEVADKLRAGDFPADVIHLDTGWFPKDWHCTWEFSPERFPDPAGYMKEMLKRGFRVSLWQTPSMSKQTHVYEYARDHGFLPAKTGVADASALGEYEYSGRIDFTNPAAVEWYQGMLRKLLEMGAAAIKTDFGEQIEMQASYHGMPAAKLHNLYALLYQKAAYEAGTPNAMNRVGGPVTEQVKGQAIIWARAGWIGCQRYPVHWGGDAASTWDGLAGSLRGGLHIGLSGWAFWSHDVPGFHGVPEFMNSPPSDELYVRWTQFGVFTSHMRYHGTCPREPYEYPAVADIVRKWWKLRYCLVPYLVEQGRQAARSGYPVLRALVLHHGDDPVCWGIDDQFYCGSALLVAPVMNDRGVRDVYLPAGRWVDFWTGEVLRGRRWLRKVASPLSQMPVYARSGQAIRVYPLPVSSTNDMDLSKAVELRFDSAYRGLAGSVLQNVLQWQVP